MKNILKLTKIAIVLGLFLGYSLTSLAQGPPPPPPGGHGSNTNQPPQGGNAPIGEGMVLLLGLGAAFGAGKIYQARRKEA